MILLGVDPGSMRTGWGAIASDGRRHRLIEAGVLAPAPSLSLPDKLRFLHDGLSAAIARHGPSALAVEDVFHAANTRSALVLGHVRGVLLLAGAQAGVPVHAFPPATVKAQIAGYGRAEKHQVALMVSRLLELTEDRGAGDATDALAVALCLACQNPDSPVQALVAEALASRPRRRRA
jgi:crossover junction endodeoxyribonuclease RuvC